ncbi:hypothetical protein ACWFQ4_24315, partial [Streptomyces koyangensis]
MANSGEPPQTSLRERTGQKVLPVDQLPDLHGGAPSPGVGHDDPEREPACLARHPDCRTRGGLAARHFPAVDGEEGADPE